MVQLSCLVAFTGHVSIPGQPHTEMVVVGHSVATIRYMVFVVAAHKAIALVPQLAENGTHGLCLRVL